MAAHKPPRPATTGILVVDKPLGRSSMSAVAEVRRKSGGARTGHAGTLDPLATGILVVALGKATKSIDDLMHTDKQYRTTIRLDAFSSTDDEEGDKTPVAVHTHPTDDSIRVAINNTLGTFMQKPPAFSAIKIKGRRSYDLARKGDAPDLPPRPVTLYHAELVDYQWPRATVELRTAKGFYVRSFARDLGLALNTGGYCESLRRTAVGPFDESMASTLDDVPTPLTEEHLIPVDTALDLVRRAEQQPDAAETESDRS